MPGYSCSITHIGGRSGAKRGAGGFGKGWGVVCLCFGASWIWMSAEGSEPSVCREEEPDCASAQTQTQGAVVAAVPFAALPLPVSERGQGKERAAEKRPPASGLAREEPRFQTHFFSKREASAEGLNH